MPRQRTLADELADLATAAPEQEYDFDQELDLGRSVGDSNGAARSNLGLDASDGEDGDFGAAAAAAAAAAGASGRGKSRRPSLRAAPELGKEYVGKRVSVAEAFGEDEEEEEGGTKPFREEEDDDEEEGEDEEEEGGTKPFREEEDDDEEEGEDEEEDDGTADVPSHSRPSTSRARAGAADNDELAALDAQYAAADAAALGSRAALLEAAERDASKGRAVRAQREAWERALEARIAVQRAVAGCNRLPRPRTMALLMSADGIGIGGGAEEGKSTASAPSSASASAVAELRAAAAGVAREAASLAIKLTEAAEVLAVRASGRESGRKRKKGGDDEEDVDDEGDEGGEDDEGEEDDEGGEDDASDDVLPETAALWRRLDRSISSFEPARDAAFDRWHRKAALLSGGGATLRGGLRVLDQPPSRQVAAAMAGCFRTSTSSALGAGAGDKGYRILARSRLLSSQAPKRLGEPEATALASRERENGMEMGSSSSDSDSSSNDSDDGGGGDGDVRRAPPDAPDADARDRDTYDDGEFYSQLLKEFVEAAAASTPGAVAAAAASGGRPGSGVSKRRKVVDRRASKGRKLRYDVQEKLVGFMAPEDADEEEPALARQLVGCLFGVVRKKGGRRAKS